ncbi:mechanosensitive ion channel family protein [Candidatus Halobonum tyrrellensis]|uniref:Small-conductance mechanosensitive channel n=1 Tax=Candidatus Halobonum tyrrellensis G22 TaxID=1324957 RepID=V4HC21_9EURY|nr:mechanosensitive ion channel family protein [Candidatus Halobonum tyrrellensis]ESP87598.1 small-conductance mechanosensitive channel [Candidatus Halobonum tyrrellensis G22]
MRPLPFGLQTWLPGGPLPEPFTAYTGSVEAAVAFLLVAAAVYLVGRLVVEPSVVRVVRARNRRNPTLQSAVETYLGYAVVVVALFAGFVSGGYTSLANPALVVAALTVALGVAGREVLGSLISGLFLIADPDFNVGDFVSWPNGEGTVQEVDFRVTRIRTPAYETLTVPNTELTTNSLTRPFGRKRARIDETIHLAYDDDVELARELLAGIAREDDRVLADPEPNAIVDTLGEGSVTLRAVFWVDDPTGERVYGARVRFRERALERLPAAGIELGAAATQSLSGALAVSATEERDDRDRTDGEGGTRP